MKQRTRQGSGHGAKGNVARGFSRAFSFAIAVAIVPIVLIAQTGTTVDVESNVDAVFAKYTPSTPGCAVGVATNGKPALARAYGMSDLEHDIRITPDSIFEAGSVSKQFTAAAVLLLARDGKLSLDDPVRKYIPELPDYEALASPKPPGGGGGPLTMRHMLNHTSGLRDWGSVAGIGGWPRTTRVHTQAHMLDIVSRQRALNFTPGTRWSYSNTGFNLAAMIVSRVSGTPFPEFTHARLFAPLGMTHTSWRDDYTRIVKDRAIAYSDGRDGFHTDMPFENVYGNGGLLTTVGDLLKWNENFVSPVVGDKSFVDEEQQRGKFADGRAHGYGLGLFVGRYQGLREVSHSGSTAGYSAFLTRFPDQHLSVAVLCNVSSAPATQYAHAVADAYLAGHLKPPAPLSAQFMALGADLDDMAGLYRNKQTGAPLTLVHDKNGVHVERGQALVAVSPSRFVTAAGQALDFDSRGAVRVTDEYGTVDEYEPVSKAKPTLEQLAQLAGTYASDEAEASMTAAVENGGLVLKRRPDATIKLTPLYADAFSGGSLGTVIFRRDAAGRPSELSVVQDRVWDLRFVKRQ
jgi:CubicO group peptidase (beta-lactamase class C family)